MRNALALPILFALVGCAGKNLDIGPTGTGGPASMGGAPREMGGAVVPLPTWPDPGACDVSGSTAVNGVWKGYIEMMPAPWDTLLLVIRGASTEGTLCGTMTIGTGTPPPPATDPDVGYPPGVNLMVMPFWSPPIIQGFTYTLLNGTLQDGRVRFFVGYNQPWQGWCGLQAPVPDTTNPGVYHCLPNSGFSQPEPNKCQLTNGSVVDCGKLMLCDPTGACFCNAKECTANPMGSGEAFDLHFDAASADGSTLGGRTRFFRAE